MVSNEENSVLEPLGPLVREGYKALAARAANGLTVWYSSLSPEAREGIDLKLSSISLSEPKPAKTLYVATGGVVQQRNISRSGSLLGDSLSCALKELAALSDKGDVAGISTSDFDRMFFALDYGIVGNKKVGANYAVEVAIGIAVSYYTANGGREFVRQLGTLSKLGCIRISPSMPAVEPAENGKLARLFFLATDSSPFVVNVINGLRLLYIAAAGVLEQPSKDFSGLREKIAAASAAHNISSPALEACLADDSSPQSIAALLDKVSLHRGVEAVISGCSGMRPGLKEIFALAKSLDTVMTGKTALSDKDKPYSDAIGLAELVS